MASDLRRRSRNREKDGGVWGVSTVHSLGGRRTKVGLMQGGRRRRHPFPVRPLPLPFLFLSSLSPSLDHSSPPPAYPALPLSSASPARSPSSFSKMDSTFTSLVPGVNFHDPSSPLPPLRLLENALEESRRIPALGLRNVGSLWGRGGSGGVGGVESRARGKERRRRGRENRWESNFHGKRETMGDGVNREVERDRQRGEGSVGRGGEGRDMWGRGII